jgi:peptide/nickel transport system permease protein
MASFAQRSAHRPDDPATSARPEARPPGRNALRLARYLAGRIAVLALAAVAGVYVTILAANLGGYVDEIVRNQIRDGMLIRANTPEMLAMTPEQRVQAWEAAVAAAEEAAGLNEPLLLRSARWLRQGITLDLGSSRSLRSIYAIHQHAADRYSVRVLILERVPATLLLLGVSNLLLFLGSLVLALVASRRYGSWADRLIVALSPISSAPAWFYGIFLIAIFASRLGILPHGGMFPSPPPDSGLLYALGVAQRMILPFGAILLSVFFQSVHVWRNFFLIHANEDYVEMARAKGLPAGHISRHYILRPALPPILTNLALVILATWSGSVMLETLFAWPGLGQLFYMAIRRFEINVIVGLTVIYAGFMSLTTLLLDIAYALVDPRVRLGSREGRLRARVATPSLRQRLRHLRARLLSVRAPQRRAATARSTPLRAGTATEASPTAMGRAPRQRTGRLGRVMRGVARYPAALAGLTFIALLLGATAYAAVALPLDDAIAHWRSTSELVDSPRNARPVWFNLFARDRLPETILLDSADASNDAVLKRTESFEGGREILISYIVEYPYDVSPQDVAIQFATPRAERPPHVALSWHTPDGRDIRITELAPRPQERYYPDQDARLVRRLRGATPSAALFALPDADEGTVLQGTYRLELSALFFEEADVDLDARLVLQGHVHGLAGTDHRRRDLMVALLWGTPTALAFGLLAACLTALGTMLIAAVAAWFGGLIDESIQRLTEINLVLPVLPLLAMVTLFYTLSIWYILAGAVLLSILGSALKTYRAAFLQAKDSPYIESARAYGASDARIITRYLIPRVAPMLVPQIVTLVPAYVFLEAALAFLGISDPLLPTWGKIIHDATSNNALLNGHYYWIIQPAALLFLTGLSFTMIGSALDRVLNPSLRDG